MCECVHIACLLSRTTARRAAAFSPSSAFFPASSCATDKSLALAASLSTTSIIALVEGLERAQWESRGEVCIFMRMWMHACMFAYGRMLAHACMRMRVRASGSTPI